MEGSEIWISFRRIWISFRRTLILFRGGFDFVPTDFEFLPRVLEVGKGRGVDPLRRCGVGENVGLGLPAYRPGVRGASVWVDTASARGWRRAEVSASRPALGLRRPIVTSSPL